MGVSGIAIVIDPVACCFVAFRGPSGDFSASRYNNNKQLTSATPSGRRRKAPGDDVIIVPRSGDISRGPGFFNKNISRRAGDRFISDFLAWLGRIYYYMLPDKLKQRETFPLG